MRRVYRSNRARGTWGVHPSRVADPKPKGLFTVFDDFATDDVFKMSDALVALRDLEQSTSEAIIAQRSSERIDIRTEVTIKPGNASERHRFSIHGMTGDISNGGMLVLLSQPLLAGDIYWVDFPDPQIRIDSLLARCLRCRMIQEETFEAGFRFLHDIDLKQALEPLQRS